MSDMDILYAAIGALIGYQLGGVVMRLFLAYWADREEARQKAKRQRLNRIMQASPPRAAGMHSRRIG